MQHACPRPISPTALTYRVKLKLQGMMMLMLSKMVDTQKFHGEQMRKVFSALEKWLAGEDPA